MFPFKSIARYPKFRSTRSKKSPKPEFSRKHAAPKKRFELFVVPIWGIILMILCFLVSNRLSKKSPKPECLRRQAVLKKRLELFVVPI